MVGSPLATKEIYYGKNTTSDDNKAKVFEI